MDPAVAVWSFIYVTGNIVNGREAVTFAREWRARAQPRTGRATFTAIELRDVVPSKAHFLWFMANS